MSLKILVFDNRTQLAERLTRAAFDQQDCQIINTTSVALAVFLARKNFPAIIIAGAATPDDLDLIHEIKTDRDLAHIPIIIVSSQQNKELADSALLAGATKYLCPPLNEERLFRELSPYLIEISDDRPKETSE